MERRRGLLSLLVLLIAGLAACSSNEAGSDSHAEVVAAGDAVCQRERAERRQVEAKVADADGGAAFAAAVRSVAAVMERANADLKSIDETPDETLSSYLAARDRGLAAMERLAQAAETDAPDFAERVLELEEVAAKARRLAQDYGFTVCGAE